jgi:hypothetical protein
MKTKTNLKFKLRLSVLVLYLIRTSCQSVPGTVRTVFLCQVLFTAKHVLLLHCVLLFSQAVNLSQDISAKYRYLVCRPRCCGTALP